MKHDCYTEEQTLAIAKIRQAAFTALQEYSSWKEDYLKTKNKGKAELDAVAEQRLLANLFFKEKLTGESILANEAQCLFAMSVAEVLAKFQEDVDAYIFDFLENK